MNTVRPCNRFPWFAVSFLLGTLAAGVVWPAAAQQAVTTFHGDNGRTGWNQAETVLTPASVSGGGFGQLATIPLDAQVNAQPLVVPGVVIAGDPNAGQHDVVYVATVGNTVYAIDPTAATVLLSRNLGAPPPPGPDCGSPRPGAGILGTPVIDPGQQLMYLIAYTQEAAGPTYRLHALALATLADAMPPVVVAATQTLSNGAAYLFNAAVERQRPALLLANGAVYAGFGAFCDANASRARGWVMGWSASSLQPLNLNGSGAALGELTNRLASSPRSTFLASVWMSGSGLAADAEGVYFSTGNSDRTGTTYDGVNAIQNSVIKLAPSTGAVLDLFTPANVSLLDQKDLDFAAGGVMLLPSLGAGVPLLATAAGKFGQMYLLDRDHMGGFTPGGPDQVVDSVAIGSCWCVESYFAAPTPMVVSSGGRQLMVWQVNTTPVVSLSRIATLTVPPSSQDGGFFTAVSSNGAANPIIWAVVRPPSGSQTVTLAAFGAVPAPHSRTLPLLFNAPAGIWPAPNSNAFIMPVIANGRVYVASYQQLAIFGLMSP